MFFPPIQFVWHRCELRTHDHPALAGAAQIVRETGGLLVPIVIIDDAIFSRADLTPRRQAHFLENVRALRESYRKLGANLVVRRGDPPTLLRHLAQELKGVKGLHFIRNYTPYAIQRDATVRAAMGELGVEVSDYGGQYTHEPGEVLAANGNRYGVFGAYRKKWESLAKPELAPAPPVLPALPGGLDCGEIPFVASDVTLPRSGEDAALGRLEWFLKNGEKIYERTRDQPGLEESTSKLSLYFNLGVCSPRLAQARSTNQKWGAELTWWDFYADVLERAPQSAKQSFKADWQGFPWRDGSDKESHIDLEKWRTGQTGFPFVDAGMRELNATGFMHNRVRMVVASFLTKNLLIDWRVGEEIFRGLLLCGDRAQNVGNWQWVAGCGVDPTPYFRVFNPTTQGEKFDSDGDYVRRWVPELETIERAFLYNPHKSRKKADYPPPMIDLAQSRNYFLETAKTFFQNSKSENSTPQSDPQPESNE